MKKFLKRLGAALLATVLFIPCVDLCVEVQAASYPAYYSSVDKGYISPVKDQGKYGTCWSFAAIAAIEASLARTGLTDNKIDLSEGALAYFMFNTQVDPLGLTIGDTVSSVSSNWLDEGGYSTWANNLLTTGQGLVYEKDAKYELMTPDIKLDSKLAYGNTPYSVKNTYWAEYSDRNSIKELVTNYGAVVVSYYMNQDNFNDAGNAYYFGNNSDGTGHAGVIVGWDDNYPASNFNTTDSIKNGAWLIKNSWGTGSGDNGYFWMSYYSTVNSTSAIYHQYCIAYEMQKEKNDNLYQYDGACGESFEILEDKAANVFRSYVDEKLTSVSFMLGTSESVDYDVYIYTNLKKLDNPESGKLASKITKKTRAHGGYVTVELPKAVSLPKGTAYSVVVKTSTGCVLQTELNSVLPCMDVTATTLSGQSFTCNYFSGDWEPSSTNLRIKAHTNNTKGVASKEASGKSKEVDGFTLAYNNITKECYVASYNGNASQYTIDGKIGNTKITAIGTDILKNNTTLKKLTIKNISKIDANAFSDSGLTEVIIENVDTIGIAAFADNKELTKLQLKNIGDLGYISFSSCENLKNVSLKGHFGEIQLNVFAGTPIKTLDIPDVDVLEDCLGYNSTVEKLIISGTVKDFNMGLAFSLCPSEEENSEGKDTNISTNLKEFVVKGYIEKYSKALAANPDSSLYNSDDILKLVSKIKITIPHDKNGFIYSKDGKNILTINPKKNYKTLTIDDKFKGDHVISIGVKKLVVNTSTDYITLENIVGLQELVINSNTRVLIGDDCLSKLKKITVNKAGGNIYIGTPFAGDGYRDRYGAVAKDIKISGRNDEVAKTAKDNSFTYTDLNTGKTTKRGTKLKNGLILSSDGKTVFTCKKDIKNLVIPKGVETVAYRAFFDTVDSGVDGRSAFSLKSVSIPDSVKTIESYAFAFNRALSKITISNKSQLRDLASDAFYDVMMLNYEDYEKLNNIVARNASK